MKSFFHACFILLFSVLVFACDNEESLNHDPNFNLEFSLDSLTFDTIFTGLPSTTKQLKIYNRSSKPILIDNINLKKNSTNYQLNINGIAGNHAKQITIPAKDSLYIFVQLHVPDSKQDAARLIENHIQFTYNSNTQYFLLKSWAQDVIRFTTTKLQTQTWTKNKPYYIEKNLILESAQELTIEAGTKIYFQKGTGLYIDGNLNINGQFKESVFMSSYRREKLYENVPGQWDGLFFSKTSKNNFISHLHLENAIAGITAQSDANTNTIEMEYSKLLNFSTTGIHAKNFNLKMHDVIVSNCGKQTVLLEGNADFKFSHCDFINYWQVSVRTDPAFSYRANQTNQKKIKIYNSIIYGPKSNEFDFQQNENIEVENSLIRLDDEKQNNFSKLFKDCIFNTEPEFVNRKEHDYQIRANSVLINKAKLDIAKLFPFDFNGNSRLSDTAPDIGSLEYIEE